MSEPGDPVDRKNLRVTGRHKAVTTPNLSVSEVQAALDDAQRGVVIVVTQAYGPRGDNLVGISDVTFDGHPAVTLKLRADGREGLIHLSPIHGDGRKQGFTDLSPGTRCELLCPVSGQPLDFVSEVEDGSGARYYAIYLTDQLSQASMVMVSDVWGHYHSRIVDDFELISAWAASHD
jgi:hypothetical protein